MRLWEAASGKLIRQLRGHQDGVLSVVFSPDGKTLASGGRNTPVLIWLLWIILGDVSTTKLDPKAAGELVAELADEDAAKAYLAGHTLIVGGKDTVTFLQRQLRPVPVSVDVRRIPRLLADLDSNEFAVRNKASGPWNRWASRRKQHCGKR